MMKLHILFWIVFCAIGLVLGLRLSGTQIPAWVILLLAVVMGAFGLYVFVANMRSARRGWNRLFEPATRDQIDGSSEKKQ
jgi:uncharacterized integral membrane protein